MGEAGEDWLSRVLSIKRWQRDGVRAPHKPLLLLYALGQLQQRGPGDIAYSDVEQRLVDMLRDFGPPRRTHSPQYPFHHLTSDGLWHISDRHGNDARPLDTRVAALRSAGARGRLDPGFADALQHQPGLMSAVAHALLDINFPPSVHAEVAARSGLDLDAADSLGRPSEAALERPRLRRRDARFREAVLQAYEYQCAFCGYEGWVGGAATGLEAAHVRWWAFEGPDAVENGLSLCTLHHLLFDRGVLGLSDDHTITVSQAFVGRSSAARVQVLELAGAPAVRPQLGQPQVAHEHLRWHALQVFRSPRRVETTRDA